MTNTNQGGQEGLSFLSSEQRLQVYQIIVNGCAHLWSKGRLQDGRTYVENGETKTTEDKVTPVLNVLIPLIQTDPYFLAHLTSYAIDKLKTKDLHVFLTFVSALSTADGLPFSPGSKYKKPNLRYVAAAALHKLDPKLALRVAELSSKKFEVSGYLRYGRHGSQMLVTAIKKYLKYRETNLDIIRGIKKAGLGKVYKNLYRSVHMAPSDEAAAILRWQQKNHEIVFANALIDFKGLTDLQIAEKIRKEKINIRGAISGLGEIKKKVSPVVAIALLEQANGNDAVILQNMFRDLGLLNDAEVLKLFEEKIKTASTALDRAETLSKEANEEIKKIVASARSESNKSQTAGLGKVYLHLDDSGSMSSVRDFAMKRGAIIAECVNNPRENFKWGLFGSYGVDLPLPDEFERDAFSAVLFGRNAGSSTDCFALYAEARKFGAEVDFFVSDQDHTDGNLKLKIEGFHKKNPQYVKPRVCVVVDFGRSGMRGTLSQAYLDNEIPVVILDRETLTESALVVQTIVAAMKGPVAIIDEIMAHPLLTLPPYYYAV